MVDVSETLTRQVAELARLELTDAEVRTFTDQLGKILGYVEQLQKVDVQGVAPLMNPFELSTPMREDEIVPSPTDAVGKPKVLRSAPEALNDGFKVPPIL